MVQSLTCSIMEKPHTGLVDCAQDGSRALERRCLVGSDDGAASFDPHLIKLVCEKRWTTKMKASGRPLLSVYVAALVNVFETFQKATYI